MLCPSEEKVGQKLFVLVEVKGKKMASFKFTDIDVCGFEKSLLSLLAWELV